MVYLDHLYDASQTGLEVLSSRRLSGLSLLQSGYSLAMPKKNIAR